MNGMAKIPIYWVEKIRTENYIADLSIEDTHNKTEHNVLMLIWILMKKINGFRKLNNHGFDD